MPGPLILISKSVPGDGPSTISKGAHTMPATTGRGTYTKIVKAKGKPMLAVFSQSGELLGTIDPDDLNKVSTATPAEQKQVDAQAAPAASEQDKQEQAAQEVAKSCAAALAGLKPRPNVVKKGVGGMTVDAAFAELVKGLDPSHQTALKTTVSHQSLKLMTGLGVDPKRSMSIAKRAAVRVAQAQGLI